MQAKIQAVRAKVTECIRIAEQRFGITMPQVDVRFDLKGRAAGIAGYRGRNFFLRFNVNHMALGGLTWDHLLNDTVPHEVAHTVCQAFPNFGRNHDAGWKRVCVALGGNGRRCYSEDDAPEAVAAQRPYVYVTTQGHEVRVTKVMHAKIQRGSSYTFKGGKGQLTRECQYNYMAAPVVNTPRVVHTPAPTVQMPAPEVRRPAPVTAPVAGTFGGGSNADKVRARIALAKREGQGEEAVIQWAVINLGQTRSLARSYVKNNWNKV